MDSNDLISRIEGELGTGGGRDAPTPLHPPPRVSDHELVRRIGAGSYGEVWLARAVTGQWRAVKAVSRDRFSSDRPYEREFHGVVRFEPISRAHSGLVQVLHVGRDDAARAFYYVMELADAKEAALPGSEVSQSVQGASSANVGSPIADSLIADYSPRTLRSDLRQRGHLSVPEAVALGVELTGALGHIHRHGLVHRDVKPSNVIFVHGQAKLADLGLVTSPDEAKSFVGTEGFIPPEGPGTVKADLFALGRLLYEAVTGKDRCEFPELPSDLDSWPNREEFLEFNEVVTQLCAPDPQCRYTNAAEVAGDLNLIMAGRSVRRANGIERRLRQARRITLMTLIGLALLAGLTWFQQQRQRQAEARAAHERLLREGAEQAEREKQRQLHTALYEQARALVLSRELGHRTRALDALRRAAEATNKAEMRRVAFAALARPDWRLEREVPFGPDMTLVQPDPTLERVAFRRQSGPVTIQSLPDLKVLTTLPDSTSLEGNIGAWSADGRFFAVLDSQPDARGTWQVWNVGQTQRVARSRSDAAYRSAAFHPRRPVFIVGHAKGRLVEWDLEQGRELRTVHLPNTPHALAYSPDGDRLAASYRQGTNWFLAFHDAVTLEVRRVVDWPEPMEQLAWHPQGRWVCGTGPDATAWGRGVQLVEVETGVVTTLGEHKIKTALCEFTADGDYLVSGGWDREITCWDLRTMQRVFGYAGTTHIHLWHASGRRCAVLQPQGVLELFAFERPDQRELSGNPGHALYRGQFSPDGRWLVARDDRRYCVWDLARRAPATILNASALPKAVTFFSPDSTELFLAVPDEAPLRGYLERWRLAPGAHPQATPEARRLPAQFPKDFLNAAVVSNELLVTSAEGVRLVAHTNLASGEGRVVAVPPGSGYVSPDGRWLAMIYSWSPIIGIYRLPAVQEVARLQTGHFVGSVTFSPEGDELMVINRAGVEWFDTATWKLTRRQTGAPVSGAYAIYTPDGRGIWMVTHFRNAALLDRRTLEPLLPLPNDVLPLAISPDGRQLAVSVEGRRAQIWDVARLRDQLGEMGLDWKD